MRRLNKFSTLPKEDQTFILNLCEKHRYKDAAQILAKPRSEGGLSLVTSESSLCRFFAKHHPETIAADAIGQFASAIRVSHQANGEANFEAILSLVQTRILEALRAGKPIADLDKELRSLQRVQKCFLADEKFRINNDRTQEAYLDHLKQAAMTNDVDFVRNDIAEDPGAAGHLAEDFEEDLSQYDLDLESAGELPNPETTRPSAFERDAARIVAALSAKARQQNHVADYKLKDIRARQKSGVPNQVEQLDAHLLKVAKMRSAAATAAIPFPPSGEISPADPSKTPAISPIAPDFTSQENVRQEKSNDLS